MYDILIYLLSLFISMFIEFHIIIFALKYYEKRCDRNGRF